jgi:hypothetical protein
MKELIIYSLLYLCQGDAHCERRVIKCVESQPFAMMSHDEKIQTYKICKDMNDLD